MTWCPCTGFNLTTEQENNMCTIKCPRYELCVIHNDKHDLIMPDDSLIEYLNSFEDDSLF